MIVSGAGAYMTDADGNRYLDYVLSWGPLMLGHCAPQVVEAVIEAARKGTSFGASTPSEADLAEAVIEAFPSMEKVRFVSSGTEATMSAIRLARAATNRKYIVKFEGCYHGHSDALLVKAGSGVATFGIPGSAGVPEEFVKFTLALPYNDVAALEEAFEKFKHQIACVIIEPVVGNMGCVPPKPGYLQAVRSVTEREGSLLIFDEVMTGFRVSYGGAQELYNIKPDLTTLGKVIGGGLPVGAYGGPAALMNQISPLGPVYQAGTLSGNPLAMAAGLAMLKTLGSGRNTIYPGLNVTCREACCRRLSGRARRRNLDHRQPGRQHVHMVFRRSPGFRLGDCRTLQHRTFRPLPPRHVGCRRLAATFAVRGRLPQHGTYGCGYRRHHRRCPEGFCRTQGLNVSLSGNSLSGDERLASARSSVGTGRQILAARTFEAT